MVELRHSFLKWNDIRDQAEQFRRQYVLPPDRIPVPIIDIVELELALEVIPIPDLMRKIDIDGFLSKEKIRVKPGLLKDIGTGPVIFRKTRLTILPHSRPQASDSSFCQ